MTLPKSVIEKNTNKAAASGYASLDGSSKVVQDPANATATKTASKIPIADGSGLLDTWITAPLLNTASVSGTVTPSDNTNRTPSTTRGCLVTLYILWTSTIAADDTSWLITVGAHSHVSNGLREINQRAAGTTAVGRSVTFYVPANTTWKVAKTNNGGTPTTVYSAEEQLL
jgi:hypothetical protein